MNEQELKEQLKQEIRQEMKKSARKKRIIVFAINDIHTKNYHNIKKKYL